MGFWIDAGGFGLMGMRKGKWFKFLAGVYLAIIIIIKL